MSSVNLFNTGKSALFANRASLATTGHNIANVNTEGYSRQRVEQESNPPQKIGNLVYGNGVRVRSVQRINDDFLTRQIANEMKFQGQYEEKDTALSQAENVFNEIDHEGMNTVISKFFNEFRKLATDPENEALKSTVKETGEQLTAEFHRISRNVHDIQKTLDNRLEGSVREINELVQRIATLNQDIKTTEISGSQSGDLRDKRDLAVTRLSNLIDLSISSNEKGEPTLNLTGIGPLISGNKFNKVYLQTSKADPNTGSPEGGLDLFVENLVPPKVTERIKNGRVAGIIESRDKLLGTAMNRMNEMAFALTEKVNELHRQGYSIDGKTGLNFFKALPNSARAAELIDISQEIKADPNGIATAMLPDSPGDNRMAQMISRLQHQKILSNGVSTLDDHFNSTVSDLATVTQKNRQVLDHQNHIVGQLGKIRESISGVSLDEETTNLVQFQHAFDASAKVIKVADEVLETVLRLKG